MQPTIRDVRFLPAVAMGGLVSFALFLLMHQLVATDRHQAVTAPETSGIETVRLRPATLAPVVPRELLPKRPRQIDRPGATPDPLPANPTPAGPALAPVIDFGPPAPPAIGSRPIGEPGGGSGGTGDGELAPRFQVKPMYPPEAAYQGVTGGIETCFTVESDGSVTGAHIVAATSPQARALLGQAALRTIARWNFFPRTVAGRPVATPNVCQTIRFTLSGT